MTDGMRHLPCGQAVNYNKQCEMSKKRHHRHTAGDAVIFVGLKMPKCGTLLGFVHFPKVFSELALRTC